MSQRPSPPCYPQYQAESYAFSPGHIPISHERTGGSGTEQNRPNDYSQPIPLSAVRYAYQTDDSMYPRESVTIEQHDTVHRATDDTKEYRYSYKDFWPSHARVSAAIHRIPVPQHPFQSEPPVPSGNLQHAPASVQPQQEWDQNVAWIAPQSSTVAPNIDALHPAGSELQLRTQNEHDGPPGGTAIPYTGTASPESMSPIAENDSGRLPARNGARRRQSDDDDYVERRRTGGESGWQEEKKKTVMACHFCRRRKLRCSGDQPCEHCTKRGMTCEYDEAVKRRGKGKKTLRKASSRRNASISSEPSTGITTIVAGGGGSNPDDGSREPESQASDRGSTQRLDGAG